MENQIQKSHSFSEFFEKTKKKPLKWLQTSKRISHFDEILQNKKLLLIAILFFGFFIWYMLSIIGLLFFEINA